MRALSLLALMTTLGLPSVAAAQRRPTVATDGFYVGVRANPGSALLAGWDLDIYLTRDRMLSFGPAVTVSVLGSDVPEGRRQDWMLTADFRMKIGLNAPGGLFRPYLFLGGGVLHAELPAQTQDGVEVAPANDPTQTVRGRRVLPELSQTSAMLVTGAGGDVYLNSHVALCFLLATRFQLRGDPRVPDAFFELSGGVRFGM